MRHLTLPVLCLVIVAGACSRREPPPIPITDANAAVKALRQRFGTGERVTADLLVSGEMMFRLYVWCDHDGAVRLSAVKAGAADFLDAVISADGSFVAGLPQSREAVRGKLGDLALGKDGKPVAGTAFLAQVRRLADEIRQGPIPDATAYAPETLDGRILVRCRHDERTESLVELNAGGTRVLGKDLIEDGKPILHIAYAGEVTYDRLTRPERTTFSLPGETAETKEHRIQIRLTGLDQVPGFRAGTFSYQPPAAWKSITPADLMARLGEH